MKEQMQFGDWLPYKVQPAPEPSSTLRGIEVSPPNIRYEVWVMYDEHVVDTYEINFAEFLPDYRGYKPRPWISPMNAIVAIEDGIVRPLTLLERRTISGGCYAR